MVCNCITCPSNNSKNTHLILQAHAMPQCACTITLHNDGKLTTLHNLACMAEQVQRARQASMTAHITSTQNHPCSARQPILLLRATQQLQQHYLQPHSFMCRFKLITTTGMRACIREQAALCCTWHCNQLQAACRRYLAAVQPHSPYKHMQNTPHAK